MITPDPLAMFEGIADAVNARYAEYKSKAKTRGYVFKITKQDFKELCDGKCHYCGSEPANVKKSTVRKGVYWIYNGIDRVDNHKGYVTGNVVACCAACNRAKLKMTKSEYVNHCKRVVEHSVEIGRLQ